MARGLSQPMAPSTRASDRDSNSAGIEVWRMRARAISMRLVKRGLDHKRLCQRAAGKFGHDHAVAKYIGAVAVGEFVHLGGVPEERTPYPGLVGDDAIDLQ